jgi:PHS family inorganic phosphate transporter-like MFS transporter
MADNPPDQLLAALDDAKVSRFHLRTAVVAGMGFFTDAYDLFIIGIASTLIGDEWHISSGVLGLVNSMTLLAAFLGAFLFGRIADKIGRKRVYWILAAIMIVGALGSALAPSIGVLIAFRFILGLGIGGDYPISAVLMSEYANRKDRGKLVSTVFSTQALGTIVGPLVALALVGGGAGDELSWRLMLGLGAIPAAAVLYLRTKLPESPRYQAQVQGRTERAARQLDNVAGAELGHVGARGVRRHAMGLKAFLSNRRYLVMLLGTAGAWFIFDYAYYGNTISTPRIIKLVSPTATTLETIAIELAIFVVAALPGYLLAIAKMDRIGHRRLQWIGFTMMAICFAVIGLVPGVSTMVAPFIIVYGISYFFAEFGPNTTTFVMPAELYPVSMRATGHGISAGTAKLGAFIGVFLFPVIEDSLGLAGTLTLSAGLAAVGALLTLLLPEPAGRSLEELTGADDVVAEAEQVLADAKRKVESEQVIADIG